MPSPRKGRRRNLPKTRAHDKRSKRRASSAFGRSLAKDKRQAKKRERERLWRLESGLTYSAMSQWIENPEAFYLNYCEGLTPRRLSKPLEFGSIFHLMLEHQFKGKRKSAPDRVAKEISTAYEVTRKKTCLPNEFETLHLLCKMAQAIFPRYCEFWKEEDAKIVWIGREQQFKTEYQIVDFDGRPRTIFLRGMRDGLFRDGKRLGVFETKTKEQIDQEAIRAILQGDMQTLLYLFTAKLDYQEDPKKILYNVVRRPGQQRKSESVGEFVKRVITDIEKRSEHYFMRWDVDLLPKDLQTFEDHTLKPTLRLFLRWADNLKKNRWDSPFHWNNLNALVGRYGKSMYWEAIVNGRRSTYYQRQSVFPELEESIL